MSTQHDDDRLLQTIIGTELVADATHDQRRRILNAIHQNREGVQRLVAQIGPTARSRIAILISKIDQGAHLAPRPTPRPAAIDYDDELVTANAERARRYLAERFRRRDLEPISTLLPTPPPPPPDDDIPGYGDAA
jgi:hypothetical protein